MPNENQTDPRKNFVPRFLPWLLGGVMLMVYWFTLNHWVTLLNVYQVANVSGWIWQPQIFNPLTFLATLPFRWLPAAHIPAALNLFSAVCAAATMAVLARSVAILPHDRTEMERMREKSDFSFLTSWVAWVPPVVAVTFAGLQLAFWERATSFTGESLELLWFAVILWQLLVYRLDERESRLFVAAFLYGTGLTENWALVGFIPLFVMMIIWLRKLDFFNLHFLVGMTLCGMAGLFLFFLLPLINKFSSNPMPLWETIKLNLKPDWQVIHMLARSDVRHNLALMSLTSLLPAFVMSIRWSASFGDSSQMGATLVNYMMHLVNAALFGTLMWVTLDPPFGAYKLAQEIMPVPALTFCYVAALCIGYYCGYALLIFGRAPIPTRRNARPDPALPAALNWLCPVIVAGTLALVVLAAGLLVYKNAPMVRAANGDSLLKYAQFAEQKLPPGGAVVLCDSDSSDPNQDSPVRAYLLQAALARDGHAGSYPVVDTKSLNWAPYHAYLHKRFPDIWPQILTTNNAIGVSPLCIYLMLNQFSKSNNLCYLNPSFGYYFEQFYQEPHGMVYLMKLLPEATLLPPPLDKNLIAENELFWKQVLDSGRPAIEDAQHPLDYKKLPGTIGQVMRLLHMTAESDQNALMAGTIYSRDLNFLGVQAQRAGELDGAASMFRNAQELNPNNVVAGINLDFNKALRAGLPTPVSPGAVTPDRFGKYRNWNEVMAANGPFDETSFCFENGVFFMQAGLMRQATALFNRVRQLAPDNLAARLFLAQVYIGARLPDEAMEALYDPLKQPQRFALTEFNSTELDILAAAAHFQKNENAAGVALLETEMVRHPDDETLMLVSAQVFNMRGLYTNALRAINRKLARSPDDPTWLYGKGIASVQVGDYNEAVKAMSRFLEIQTNSPDALYNRGLAYFKSDQLDAARADFLKLQSVYTNNSQVAYGLGEIAWRQHETNEALRNYKVFIANTPTNTVELKSVRERVAEIGGK